jgi:hypothetical protein
MRKRVLATLRHPPFVAEFEPAHSGKLVTLAREACFVAGGHEMKRHRIALAARLSLADGAHGVLDNALQPKR